jgi:hypothetical protein
LQHCIKLSPAYLGDARYLQLLNCESSDHLPSSLTTVGNLSVSFALESHAGSWSDATKLWKFRSPPIVTYNRWKPFGFICSGVTCRILVRCNKIVWRISIMIRSESFNITHAVPFPHIEDILNREIANHRSAKIPGKISSI